MPLRQFLPSLLLICAPSFAAAVDLSRAVVVTPPGPLANAESTAATVLIEEIEKRTGIRLSRSTDWPQGQTAIVLASQSTAPRLGRALPGRAETRPEGYRLFARENDVWVIGADARGALFGAGHLLRKLDWARGKLS